MRMKLDRPDELGGSSSISAGNMAGYVKQLHGAESRKEEETAESIIITCLQRRAYPSSSSRAPATAAVPCSYVSLVSSVHQLLLTTDGRAGELQLSATARHRDRIA